MTFESGSAAGTVDCVNIGIISDDSKEANESFVFALCAGGDPSVHIDKRYADVYIIDEDGKLQMRPIWLEYVYHVKGSKHKGLYF